MNVQSILALLVLLIFLGFVALLVLTADQLSHQKIFRDLARIFGGKVHSTSPFHSPILEFMHRDRMAQLDVIKQRGASKTVRIRIAWPDESFRFEFFPQHEPHRSLHLAGLQDIQIGSPQFDKRYVITGNDPEKLRQQINADVQSTVEQLRQLGSLDDIYVGLNRRSLQIHKRWPRFESLVLKRRFVELGLQLADALLAARHRGIDFVSMGTLALDSGICQVCGEEVEADAVYCQSCKTPHHQDCWQYYGGCSTFGCGTKTFWVAKQRAREP